MNLRRLPRLLALGLGALFVVHGAAVAAGTGASAPPPRPRATVPAAKPGAAPAAKKAAGPRTLDPVHIEGELDVPEVLFITARDQRRIVDFQHARYLPSSRDLAKRTPMPTRIVLDHPAPAAPAEVKK